MKASDKPQLTKKWWTSEKPSEVKGAELEKALMAIEKALADEKKKSDAASIECCLRGLKDLESAVDKTVKCKELKDKKHKDVVTVLEKYHDLIKGEQKRLEDAQAQLTKGGEEDEEEEE